MRLDEACRVLGVEPGDDWPAVRRAYRTLIRSTHPDVGGVGSQADDASTVTAAFAVIRDARERLGRPAVHLTEGAAPPSARSDIATLRLPEGDPFLHLLDAGHRLGEITYQDADAGLFQVLIELPATALLQLTGEMTVVGQGVQVQFSLEALGPGSVPEIADVVTRFGRLTRTD